MHQGIEPAEQSSTKYRMSESPKLEIMPVGSTFVPEQLLQVTLVQVNGLVLQY